MIQKKIILILITISLIFSCTGIKASAESNKFIALCYHAVVKDPDPKDSYTLSYNLFAKHMEYLKANGYHPISLDQILMAQNGVKPLPPKAVLLMFDDGYISYKDFILPLLEKYEYPSVLAVVGNFVGYKPDDIPEPIMTWEQIREVSKNKLVEIAAHSYDMHKAVRYTPQGNIAAAFNVKLYNEETKSIETPEQYIKRIEEDFTKQQEIFEKELGFRPRAMVWPYGKYNQPAVNAARKFGYQFAFTLENGYGSVDDLLHIKRNMLLTEPIDELNKSLKIESEQMIEFIKILKNSEDEKTLIRAVQVDIDLLYDPDPVQVEKNLSSLLDRLVDMRVNTVFLQAFADPEGTGNIKSVYFPNRILPVKADIFSYIVHQISIREIQVYAWMPTLSIELPDKKLNESLRVKAYSNGKIKLSNSWYNRLSPFSAKTLEKLRMIYEDLASNSQIDGVLFQDDAYLNDFEDFHPDAAEAFKNKFNKPLSPELLKSDAELSRKWTSLKTEVLIAFLQELKKAVKYWRPEAKFTRNIYAEAVLDPDSEEWFAQNYTDFLRNYDFVTIMAYPHMEKAKSPLKWLNSLVQSVKRHNGLNKTIFKIQTYDWDKKEWINDTLLNSQMRTILKNGGLHLAYYPDDYTINKPMLDKIKLEMSTKTYPFEP